MRRLRFLSLAVLLMVACDQWTEIHTWTISHVGVEPYEETVSLTCGYFQAGSPVAARPAPLVMGMHVSPNWDTAQVTYQIATDYYPQTVAGGTRDNAGRIYVYCVNHPVYIPDGTFIQGLDTPGYTSIVTFYPNDTYSVMIHRTSSNGSAGYTQLILNTTRPLPP